MPNNRNNKERTVAKCSERNTNWNDRVLAVNGKNNLYLYVF